MSEENNRLPPLDGRQGSEGNNIVDFRKELAQRIQQQTTKEFPAQARKFLEDEKARLDAMDRLADPWAVEAGIFQLADHLARYATEFLDVNMGGRDPSDMSQRVDEPLEDMPSSIPRGDLGTIPLDVYDLVMNKIHLARQFIEVAIEMEEDGGEFQGSLNASRDASWSAILTLYDGMMALRRSHPNPS